MGERPVELADALAVADAVVGAAPKLIPICGHRYVPDDPPEAGNPVLSVYQTDIIYYGYVLPNFLATEFEAPQPPLIPSQPRWIRFWTDFLDAQFPE